MDNFLDQPVKKQPASIAWILSGVVIFGGVHALTGFLFSSVEFGLWFAKAPLSVIIIWKSITVPVNVLVIIVTMLLISARLKNRVTLPKTFAVIMGVIWILLTIGSQWMFYSTLPLRNASIIMDDYKTLAKVEHTVYTADHILHILTIFIGFLVFMNRKQPVSE